MFGAISVFKLPVCKLPDVDFPIVNISLTLKGASASITKELVLNRDVDAALQEIQTMYPLFG
ncbi:MAG: efflux RND transporter permease subunit [Leptospira sp.]|nr:efflux RND transporter permease subunit [Leptospira sp.]